LQVCAAWHEPSNHRTVRLRGVRLANVLLLLVRCLWGWLWRLYPVVRVPVHAHAHASAAALLFLA